MTGIIITGIVITGIVVVGGLITFLGVFGTLIGIITFVSIVAFVGIIAFVGIVTFIGIITFGVLVALGIGIITVGSGIIATTNVNGELNIDVDVIARARSALFFSIGIFCFSSLFGVLFGIFLGVFLGVFFGVLFGIFFTLGVITLSVALGIIAFVGIVTF